MSNNIISDIIKGLIVGTVIYIIFLRPAQAQPLQYPYNPVDFGFMEQQTTQKQISLADWKPLEHIPSVDDLNVVQPTAQTIIQQQTDQVLGTATEYKNKEMWKITRNKDGDIESIEVERNAKIDGGK